MPYYGDPYTGDPGLFGKIFKGLKKLKIGRFLGNVAHATTTGGVLGALGYRPASPAKGVVSKVTEIRAANATAPGGVSTVKVAAPLARRARKARATFRVGAGGRVKAESSFARRRRLGLV
jgi:hypothetical protein